MLQTLEEEAARHGDRLRAVPIEALHSIKDEITLLQSQQKLNGFQKWIVNNLYSYEIPQNPYPVKSIILAAVPHPAYAEAIFTRNNREYTAYGVPSSGFDKTEKYLSILLEQENYHITPAAKLPFKRLGVQSGLSEYGRNNITYAENMGSHFSYLAFYSDMPVKEYFWRSVCMADRCKNCMACVEHCPTGAILRDRFLIDNEKCLSKMTESADDFPEWVPAASHHTVYGCLKCQMICPMNAKQNAVEPEKIYFDEAETERILRGAPYGDVSDSLKDKIKKLWLDKWPDGIPRNLLLLFRLIDEGYISSF